MPLHPPERRPCPVRKPPGHRSECRCAKFTPVGPDVFAVRHRGGEDRPARDECRRPSLSPRRTADRTGATTKMRRGREAKCRASYPHRPAERGCKRMPEGNGRVPLRRTAGRSFLRGEAPRRDGRIQRIRSETEQADKPRKPETESTEAPLRHVGRSRRGCCCREERNRRARSEEKTHRRRFRNGGKRSAEETGSRRRTEADDRPE